MTSKKPPTIANIEEGELWKIQHQNGESVVARIDRRYHLDGDWHLRFVDEDNCTRTWPCSKIQFVWHLDFLEKEHRCTQEAPSPPKEHMNAELFCKNAMAFINSAYKGHRVLVEFNVFHAQEKTKDGDPSMLMECTWSNLVK